MLLPAAGLDAGEIRFKDLVADKNVVPINRTMAVADDALYLRPSPDAGFVWIPALEFTEGVMDVELRGRNATGQSFVGLAFHAKDAETYDAVYVRPFNFQSEDPVRRKRAIQYISIPGHDWPELRSDFPGKYEAAIDPKPKPDEWCKLRLIIRGAQLEAFVNGAQKPALRVELLNKRLKGKVGLWVGNNSDGWFRSFRVTTNTVASVIQPRSRVAQARRVGWSRD